MEENIIYRKSKKERAREGESKGRREQGKERGKERAREGESSKKSGHYSGKERQWGEGRQGKMKEWKSDI